MRRRWMGHKSNEILDFSGYSITNLFSLVKTNLAAIDYYAKIVKNGSVSPIRYTFYDANGIGTVNGQISSTTTPNEATTVQNYFNAGAGTDDYQYSDFYCQLTGTAFMHVSGSLSNAPYFAENATQIIRNDIPAIYFRGLSNGFLHKGSGFSALNTGNNFTINIVSTNESAGSAGVVFSNSINPAISNDSRIVLNNHRGNATGGLIRNTLGTNFLADLDTTYNTSNQKVLTLRFKDGVLSVFYNGVWQSDEEVVTGSWENLEALLGAQRNNAGLLLGTIQWVSIHNAGLSNAVITELVNKIKTVFNF